MSPDERAADLERRLSAVRSRIAAAAAAAGRGVDELTLVVVTKFFPASDVRTLVAAGVRDVGESRDQEAGAKVAELGPHPPGPRWHFIGQVQTNKARSVARYADAVHSVDREKLVGSLDRAAAEAGRRIDCFVQVDLDAALGSRAPDGRGGVGPEGLDALADAVAEASALSLRGLMAVAPRGAEPERAFAALAGLAARVRREHPGADALSAGMSGDLEAAVAAGATHLRVGGAILGTRPAAR